VLLALSNFFMTFAWYAHLKKPKRQTVVRRSHSELVIAFFEYLLQVPVNRAGYTVMTLPQLKILQEAVTFSVFAPFALFYMNQPPRLDYLWAAICILGPAYFMFRN
jgi:uncharacterized protein (DUF486 family)